MGEPDRISHRALMSRDAFLAGLMMLSALAVGVYLIVEALK